MGETENIQEDILELQPGNSPPMPVEDHVVIPKEEALPKETAELKETNDLNPQTEIVETHAHHLHKIPGHNWKHYLFEFFMLFLAVFCGFLAEYKLEHRIDNEKERNYIRSMIADLKKDTSNFRLFIEDGKQVMSTIDSLIFLLQCPDRNAQTSSMYFLARTITLRTPTYEIFDRTYSQMKSSGNLRLLESQIVADYISNYYFDITLLASQQNYINNFLLDYTRKASVVFNAAIFHQMYKAAGLTMNSLSDARNFPLAILPPKDNPPLANESPEAVASLIGTLHYLYARILSTSSNIRNQYQSAVGLMKGLQREYHLN